jgi:hypothetical protein
VLAGTRALDALARRAGSLASFDAPALTLPGVELLQVTYELGGGAPESFFPPALHPTLPVLAVLALWRARGSSWPRASPTGSPRAPR